LKNISRIQNKLIKSAQTWALRQKFDPEQTKALRRDAVLLNHVHYFKNIPMYQKLACEENAGENVDIETIKRKLLFPDDIFKSYSQRWLNNNEFARMNEWLSGIFHKRINVEVNGISSIDGWLERLNATGINVTFSSGTSGCFSFIPREAADWEMAKIANTCYLVPLLTKMNIEVLNSRSPLQQAVKLLPPEAFARAAAKVGLPGYDAFFLGFRQGRMGNQALMQELAPIFQNCYYLYNMDLPVSALRCLRLGAWTEKERNLVESIQNQVVRQRRQNYLQIIKQIKASTIEGQQVFIFGAPFQFKELCEFISSQNQSIALNKKSHILFGGGWKSFTGEAVKRENLVKMISDSFDLPEENILEGYSMTETSVLTVRCKCGRFHIPPIIEPVILDDELNLVDGKDRSGIFGFLDPLAVSYPGFIISGDYVHMVDGECLCGLGGPALVDIGRAKGREVKGCGGIMGSISA
jgi:hypothetical protein